MDGWEYLFECISECLEIFEPAFDLNSLGSLKFSGEGVEDIVGYEWIWIDDFVTCDGDLAFSIYSWFVGKGTTSDGGFKMLLSCCILSGCGNK